MLVTNHVGLHARRAGEFVKRRAQFKAALRLWNVTRTTEWMDTRSILSVLALGVEKGRTIKIIADGPDKTEDLQALQGLLESNFIG